MPHPVDPPDRRAQSRLAGLIKGAELAGEKASQAQEAPPGWPAEAPFPRPGRFHEIQGPASIAFAAALAGVLRGPVFWIGSDPERLDGFGLTRLLDPTRLTLARAATAEDALWAFEECLRSGAAALVACELARPPDLTAGRRLQLAAEAGGAVAAAGPKSAGAPGRGPIGLALTPQMGASDSGAGAAETRWRVAPAQTWAAVETAPRWRWTLLKNKRGPLGDWEMRLAAPCCFGPPAAAAPGRRGAGKGADADAQTHSFALDAAPWRGAPAAA